ncbi:hypothetical protein MACJ_003984 [Theileria orientalis]|uniref:Uncharacterized protein n=1 Tax=Theileria orientalis TaxID=68886 RepID=A0A976SKZ6_THEOR|nr:hypothetical protein MACJ_003984 [Theileria orientalis]
MFLIYSEISLVSMYILFNFEAFFTGFFLASFLATVSNLMPVVLLSTSVSVSFAFLAQRPIKHLYRRIPLAMFKVNGWISLAISTISFGAFIYYDYFYHKFNPSYKDTINEIKSSVDTFKSIMMDIKSNASSVYFYVSLIKTLDKNVKSLYANVNQLKSLRGITNETEIMESILNELRDKVKQLLDFIEFGIQLRDKQLYDIKVFLKTKPFQHLVRFKTIKKSWDGIKAHLEWAKANFMFKFRSPINYDHSENRKPKATTADARAHSITTQTPKPRGANNGLMPPEYSSFDPKTTPKQIPEVYSGESCSASDEEISGEGPTDVEVEHSGSGTEPTKQSSGQEPLMESSSPKYEETQITEATTARSERETESSVTVTETPKTGTETPSTLTQSTTTSSELPVTVTETPSIPTQKTSNSDQKATTALSPESGSTQMKRAVNSSTNPQNPNSTKNEPQPIIIRPTFTTDKLDLKMDRVVIDLGSLADKVIQTYNSIKSSSGGRVEDKNKCLESIHEAESIVIEMDSRINELYRGLTDELRYEHNVEFNNLKHIHIVQEKDTTKMFQTGEEMRKIFARNKFDALSPYLMFFVASLIKDFLFPSILPFAFMQIYKNDMILLAVIIEIYGSILVFIIERLATEFRTWNEAYNMFWVMAAPLVVIFVFTIMALNTNFQGIREFYSSEAKVLLLTVSILVFGSLLKQLSYVGVANYVYYQSGDILGNIKLQIPKFTHSTKSWQLMPSFVAKKWL